MFLNINEPNMFHRGFLCPVVNHGYSPPESLATLYKELAPLRQGAVLCDCAIVAFKPGLSLKALHIATGLGTPKGLLKEEVPILDASRQVAHMDKINRVFREGPGPAAVVNLTAAC